MYVLNVKFRAKFIMQNLFKNTQNNIITNPNSFLKFIHEKRSDLYITLAM